MLWYWILNELETIPFKKSTTLVLFYFFQQTIDSIHQYSRQHHSSSFAIITLVLYVSFKPISVDFTSVFDMLALLAVLILFIVCACVLFVVCFCPFQILYGWCLCRLQDCVRVKFIDVYLAKMQSLPGKNAECRVKYRVTWPLTSKMLNCRANA